MIGREIIEGEGPNGSDIRLYDGRYPSVTTILETREDDKSNLESWKERNNGEDDSAYWKHLFWYSRHIGTIGHWYALHELDEGLEWSDDEQQSVMELEDMSEKEVEGDSPREILYSVLRGDSKKAGGTVSSWGEFYDEYPPYNRDAYYTNALIERAESDVAFFKDAQLRMWSKLGIDDDAVIAVEKRMLEDNYEYAGQVDLVYRDTNGYNVVADLKSSSGCWDKYQVQGAAYAKAIEFDEDVDIETVDRLEVHRAHPRSGQFAVHTHRDAPGKNAMHTTKYWKESYDSLWEEFRNLAESYDYHK